MRFALSQLREHTHVLIPAILLLNFALPAKAAVIAQSTFDTDMGGWTTNKPSEVVWGPSLGNPDGYIAFNDTTTGEAQITAPESFLGDWSTLDGVGEIRFDHKIFSDGGGGFQAYRVFISGPAGSAEWTGSIPIGPTPWESIVSPLIEAEWSVSGNWVDVISNVTELRIRMELVVNGIGSGDIEGIDNVQLILSTPYPISPPPQQLTDSGCDFGTYNLGRWFSSGPTLVPSPGGADGLIVLVHGWTPLVVADDGSHLVIDNMKMAIETRLQAEGVDGDWNVLACHWEAGGIAPPSGEAVLRGARLGGLLANDALYSGYTKFHFIGHSTGAWLIDAAINLISAFREGAVTHATYLDAYAPKPCDTLSGGATWDEQYVEAPPSLPTSVRHQHPIQLL